MRSREVSGQVTFTEVRRASDGELVARGHGPRSSPSQPVLLSAHHSAAVAGVFGGKDGLHVLHASRRTEQQRIHSGGTQSRLDTHDQPKEKKHMTNGKQK